MRLFALLAFLLAPEEPCAVSGKVVDAITGAPLARVQLRLEQVGNRDAPISATTSDSEGKFALAGMEPGMYRLKGIRSGYLESWYGAKRAAAEGTPLRLDPGQALEGLTLRLMPGGVIAGTVRDADGEPAAGVSLELWGWRYFPQYDTRTLNSLEQTRTDDQGQFRFANLMPNQYYLHATLAQIRNVIDRSVGKERHLEVDIDTYFPSSQDASAATPIQLTPGGKLTGIDMTLARSRVYKVSGVVTAEAGVPAVANVQLLTGQPDAGLWGVGYWALIKNGRFEFTAVPPGAYTLLVAAMNSAVRYQATMRLDVGNSDVNDVQLSVGTGSELSGTLTLDGEGKVNFEECTLGFPGSRFGPWTAQVRRDGTFSTRLYSGTYSIWFNDYADPGLYLKSVKLDGVELPDQKLTVSESGKLHLDAVISRDSGTVEGTTSPGATLLLRPRGKAVNADQNGRFEIKGVPPGEYRLFAFEDLEPGAWLDPGFWKGRESDGEPVSVRAKERTTARVQISKPASMYPKP